MYGICANHKPCRAEQGKSFLSADLPACSDLRSTGMKKQFGFPRIGLFNGQMQLHRPSGRFPESSRRIGSARFAGVGLSFCPTPEAAEAVPRSARGRKPVRKHCAADELRPNSADIHLVSNLEHPSQTTPCED